MKKCILFYLLLALVAVACSPSKKNNEQAGIHSTSSALLLRNLQGEWERLTKWPDGNWVVFRPCDADNLSMHIAGDTVVIGWGQDASFGIIRSFAESEMPGMYVLTVADQDEQTILTYRMMWDDEAHNRAEWWLWDDDESVMLVRAELLDQYKLIEQPCYECWEDCEEENPENESEKNND
jgi:hypothetical protein